MDTLMNQLARELADAVAAAVANDARVDACREKAKAAGYEMHFALEATVGFVTPGTAGTSKKGRARTPRSPFEVSASDRRFLKSLRIAPDETTKQVE